MSFKGALVSFLIAAATVVGCEFAARIWLWSPATVGGEATGDRLGNARYNFAPDVAGDLVPNQNGHWIVWWRRPYHVVTNSLGFRSLEEPVAGARQIVALGDSQTFGPYVATEDTWPAWTQNELRRLGKIGPVQVHNGGISGYTIADELAWLREKGLALKPDTILLGVFENDILDYRRVLENRGSRPLSGGGAVGFIADAIEYLRANFGRNLALYNIAAEIRRERELRAANVDVMRGEGHSALTAPDAGEEFRRFADAYERDFREFVRLANSAGIRVAVVAIPSQPVVTDNDTPEVARLAGRLCGELGVPFLDLAPDFAKIDDAGERLFLLAWSADRKVFLGNGHLSREGHLEIGRRVAAWLGEIR